MGISTHKDPLVLVVEDSQEDAHLLRAALAEFDPNLYVEYVTDGQAALKRLRADGGYNGARPVGLVLLDLDLPGMSGQTVLDEMKADPALHSIPVVILTASHQELDKARAFDGLAASYLVKADDLDAFLTDIKETMQYWLHTVRIPNRNGPAFG